MLGRTHDQWQAGGGGGGGGPGMNSNVREGEIKEKGQDFSREYKNLVKRDGEMR